MASSQLNRLVDVYAEKEAEEICNAALAAPTYKLTVRIAVTAVMMSPILLAFLAFFTIRTYQAPILVRLLVSLLILLSMFIAVRVIYPINDKLVDRAISNELARRSNPPAV